MPIMRADSCAGKERMPISASLGPVMGQLRRALGIRQEDAAHEAGITPVALCRMERGLTCSSSDSYEREAQALGIDYELICQLAARLAREGRRDLTPREISMALLSRRL